ncbi:DUF6011 domain-containing protein [Kineococcus sp. NPDC059986]|uniref:DUF6011 domain-containing protein n=1 Tax=Kineococcus sp. NPDC059986 TaxID=3155538 RepID=UPI00344F65B2
MPISSEVSLRVLLPPLQAISRHPVRVIGTFVTVTLVTAAVLPDFWDYIELFRVVAVASTSTVLVSAGAVRVTNRMPPKPKEPRRKTAKLRSPGKQPPQRIPLPVGRCVMCGRKLTNYSSQLAGVGPDCQARYGSRPQYQDNPAYFEWQRRMHTALQEQQAAQREHDRVYAAARATHAEQVRVWHRQLATPRNVVRRRARSVANRTIVVDVGVLLSYVFSELVVRLATFLQLPFFA